MSELRSKLKRPWPKNCGIHGGRIESWEDYYSTPEEPSDPRVEVTIRAARSEADRQANQRAAEANALEAVLSRSPAGQRAIMLIEEVAKCRIHESLTMDLFRGATNDLERIRRVLVTTRDPLERERAASRIYGAEAEVRKWRAAHADCQNRRQCLEYALRDVVRMLA